MKQPINLEITLDNGKITASLSFLSKTIKCEEYAEKDVQGLAEEISEDIYHIMRNAISAGDCLKCGINRTQCVC